MDVQYNDNGKQGSFFIHENGEPVAKLNFTWVNNNLRIEHTEVHETLKGKGVGLKLVEEAVKHARNRGVKVVPICPFAYKVFEKNPSFGDVRG